MLDFEKFLNNLKTVAPLVHCITNYVTINDCANILLACGASPIMADDPDESAEITSLAKGLVINLGTLHKYTLPAMLKSGKQANLEGKPVVFDPVGAGASLFRCESAKMLLENINFTCIRGNISELKALGLSSSSPKGVDANPKDEISEENFSEILKLINSFSKKTGAVTVATGKVDIVSGKEGYYIIKNGHPMMSRVTGTGCMLSSLIGAFLASNPDNALDAVAAAVCAFGVAGELAYSENIGSGSYHARLIDEIFNMDSIKIKERATYEFHKR